MCTINQVYSDPQGRDIGVDVDMSQLDIHIHEQEAHLSSGNNASDLKALVSRLARYKLARTVAEDTGGYERDLVEACAEKGLPVVVVQPRQVRGLVRIRGVMVKTDKLDARVIAEFGAMMKQRYARALQQEYLGIQGVAEHRAWHRRRRCVHPARRAARTGASHQPGNRRLAWTGTVQQGQRHHEGQSRIEGGRAPIGTVLYMAMLSAIQQNPVMRNFYLRLVAQGQHKKVAITDCMRKMVTILNTMVRDQRPWQVT